MCRGRLASLYVLICRWRMDSDSVDLDHPMFLLLLGFSRCVESAGKLERMVLLPQNEEPSGCSLNVMTVCLKECLSLTILGKCSRRWVCLILLCTEIFQDARCQLVTVADKVLASSFMRFVFK